MGRSGARILLAAGLALAAATSPGAQPLLAPEQILPTAQIRPGMIAVGKSVFRGTEIEEFHLEILGVAEKVRDGGDVILARILDGTLVERQSGVLQGMSGSPVYIGDRLIGAIAFSWAFAKEPVAGITPIEDMLKVLAAVEGGGDARGPAQSSAPAATDAVALPRPLLIEGRAFNAVRISDACAPGLAHATEPAGVLTLQPVGSLLLVSGMSQRAMERLGQVVQPYGATVTQGFGGSSDQAPAVLQPGSAMGIQLIHGDFDATAIGTVTCVIGERVIALGHPMLALGEVDLPLTGAYIQGIVPSYAFSMKMGVAGPPIGRIAQDRLWAVAGVTGQQPRTIPVSVTISGPALAAPQSYSARVVRHRDLSPGLACTVALSAIDRAWQHIGEGTTEVTVEIDDGQRTIRRSDTAYSPFDAAVNAIAELAAPMRLLMDNEFGAVDIKAVRVTVRLSAEHRTARLERVSAQPGRIKAGDTLRLQVLLRPFRGEPVAKQLELALPPDLPDGPLRVGVAGGSAAQQLRSMLGLPQRRPFNLEQLIDIYQTSERANDIVAFAALPSAGVMIQGRHLPALPSHLLQALNESRSAVVEPGRDFISAATTCEWVVEGRDLITLDIQGKPGAAKGRGPALRRPGAPPTGPGEEEEEEGEEEAPPEDETRQAMYALMAASAGAAEPDEEEPGEPESEQQAQAKQEKKKEKKEEPVGRKPSSWLHTRQADFLPGEFDSVACDEEGVLTLAPQQSVVARLPEPVISALLAHGGALYVAAAPGGRVRRISGAGEVEQTWETGAEVVTSLAATAGGDVLAAAAPGGRVLRLADDGTTQEYFAASDSHIWALASAPGGIYAAGSEGKVFLVPGPGQGSLWCQLPATAVYALAAAGDTLYAGTGNAGVVYRINSKGAARAVYDSEEQAISCLAVGGGDVYVGTAPGAAVVRLRSGVEAQQMMRAEGESVAALVVGTDGLLYAVTAGDGVVYQVDPERKAARILRKPKRAQALALAADERGALYIGESNPAAVVRLGPERAQRGTFTSKPQQAGPATRWGVLACAVERPQGTSATFQTRSGDSADPDDHWSPWSPPAELGSGAAIASPPATFLQYRIHLASEQPGVAPSARDLQINYLPPNQEPVLSISAPAPAERLSGKFDIRWKARDPDGDKLSYAVSVSADGGATWQELKADLEQDTFSWNTTEVRDGSYLLRVNASDRLSNPGAARERDARRAVWVDNTPPAVLVLRHSMAVTARGRATMRGAAADDLSPLRGVDYRVDGGKWRAASIEGALGARQVSFAVETEELSPGEHKVEVRAFDQAGNTAQDQVQVKVEKSEAAAAAEQKAEPEAPAR